MVVHTVVVHAVLVHTVVMHTIVVHTVVVHTIVVHTIVVHTVVVHTIVVHTVVVHTVVVHAVVVHTIVMHTNMVCTTLACSLALALDQYSIWGLGSRAKGLRSRVQVSSALTVASVKAGHTLQEGRGVGYCVHHIRMKKPLRDIHLQLRSGLLLHIVQLIVLNLQGTTWLGCCCTSVNKA